MKTKKRFRILVLAVICLMALSLLLIIGSDTNWGKVEVTRMTLTSADGDEISAMLYKPKSASPEHPVPLAMLCHGGNDMLEQTGTYALELARRGYAVVSWDYTGCHNSDIATGTSETANGEVSGIPTMGAETVWNTVKSYNFVDFDKIITMGHSMGGQYTMAFAIAHQQEVFLQVNLGMNMYGVATNQEHNFNFANILGDADESALARSGNDNATVFQAEQLRRIFFGDYETEAEALAPIELGKTYEALGTDGKTYTRTAYMPDSCHAYYLVTDDAIRTVIYAITSQVGLGLDKGVNSYADHGKISLVWKWKDLGFILMLAATVLAMLAMASFLLDTEYFRKLKLQKLKALSFPGKSWQRITFLLILIVLPVALFRIGILAANKFLGIKLTGLWLLGGTNNSYISWQWTVSLGMLILFLVYHFIWGKKQGGTLKTYGFTTSDEAGFELGYVGRAFLFGLLTVGAGYLVFGLISAYTQQGMHIATFMVSTIKTNRTLTFIMYFLFQIPYFVTSSLAMKSIGLTETEDSPRGTIKSIAAGTGITVGGLFVLWVIFVLIVTVGKTLTGSSYFTADRMYIYTIAILPLAIGMSVANALNIFISKKTNSIWPGLFTALLWGSWIIMSCGGMSKYLY